MSKNYTSIKFSYRTIEFLWAYLTKLHFLYHRNYLNVCKTIITTVCEYVQKLLSEQSVRFATEVYSHFKKGHRSNTNSIVVKMAAMECIPWLYRRCIFERAEHGYFKVNWSYLQLLGWVLKTKQKLSLNSLGIFW